VSRGTLLPLVEIGYGLLLFLGIVAVLASIYSYHLGLKFDDEVSVSLNRPKLGFRPHACVVMACKGEEQGLVRNVEAILNQTYREYRTIIVTDSTEDPAYSIIQAAMARNSHSDSQLYVSETHPKASGKIAALLTALEKDAWASDVYAFVDSDAFVPPRWLEDLVDPLGDDSIGATTGFRWYFPTQGVWSHIESAWNASGTNLMFDERYNFPWGGAMALRSKTLREISIESVWKDAVSDDLALNSTLRKNGYRTLFLPQCTVATYNRSPIGGFLSWATRQIALTRVFNHALWTYGLASYASFSILNLMAVLVLLAGALLSREWFLPAALLWVPSVLGLLRSSQRISSFKRAMPEFAGEFEKNRFAGSIASLIVPWIMTYCIMKSARMNEIEWRGRKYTLTG